MMTAIKSRKGSVRLLIFASMFILLAGCAGRKMLVKSFDQQRLLHYSQLTHLDKAESLNDYAFFINKGETIPLEIAFDSDFAAFKQEKIDIVAKKKLYFLIKMPRDLSPEQLAALNSVDAKTVSQWSDEERREFLKNYMLYLSTDALHWAPLNNRNAMRKVLRYKAGTISLGMKASTTEGLGASLYIHTIE
jgi:hypothetical protein